MTEPFVAFQFQSLQDKPIVHGLSGRVMDAPEQGNAGYISDADFKAVGANRSRFLGELDIHAHDLTLARQTHGATIAVVSASDRGRGHPPDFDGFPATDAMLTNLPGIALAMTVADCVPLVLYDPERHALAVIHAGWRGTVAGIAPAAVRAMSEAFGTSPSDVLAGIGPSIGPCCYEVGDEVIEAWRSIGVERTEAAIARGRGARSHFDLWTANATLLEAAGVEAPRIEVAGVCVKCNCERYFSYRAAMTAAAQRGLMMMVAQLHSPVIEGGSA